MKADLSNIADQLEILAASVPELSQCIIDIHSGAYNPPTSAIDATMQTIVATATEGEVPDEVNNAMDAIAETAETKAEEENNQADTAKEDAEEPEAKATAPMVSEDGEVDETTDGEATEEKKEGEEDAGVLDFIGLGWII